MCQSLLTNCTTRILYDEETVFTVTSPDGKCWTYIIDPLTLACTKGCIAEYNCVRGTWDGRDLNPSIFRDREELFEGAAIAYALGNTDERRENAQYHAIVEALLSQLAP